MSKNCLVTGATGFLGLNFVEEVLDNNHFDVMYCLVRKESTRINNLMNLIESKEKSEVKVEIINGDVSSIESLESVFPEEIDAVFHIAADIDMTNFHIERQNRINIGGCKNMVEMALKKKSGRFILISSQGVYFGNDMDINEVYELSEKSEKKGRETSHNYSKSKYFGEEEVRKGIEKGLDAVILQPAMIMGELDYSHDKSMNFFITEIKHKMIPSISDGQVVITDVKALARVMISAYEKGRTGEDYLIGGPTATYEDMMKIACGFWKLDELSQSGYRFMWYLGAGFELYSCLRNLVCFCKKKEPPMLSRGLVDFFFSKVAIDNKKAVEELGYEIIGVEETITRKRKHLHSIDLRPVSNLRNMAVVLGNEDLRKDFELSKGKNIGFVGNHTSLFGDSSHIFEFLKRHAKSLKLFGPEHSFRGNVEDQKIVESEKNGGTMIFSLFGEYETPTKTMCSNIDIFIFDIQSVGVRFYTYISTLYNVMEACRRYNIELIVCDRPNPISCLEETICGPITRPCHCSFFSAIPLPLRHSMTIGELSLLFNRERIGSFPPLDIKLKVLKMRNFRRNFFFPSTRLKWVPCSPCMPDFQTTLMYPGTCLFEGTNVSEGRGTSKPFLRIGAPWMKKDDLISYLLPKESDFVSDLTVGLEFENIEFVPESLESCTKPKFLGERCYGFNILVLENNNNDYTHLKPVKLVLYLMCRMKVLFGNHFYVRKFMDNIFGSEFLRSQLNEGSTCFKELLEYCEFGVKEFKKIRSDYLLY